jgi:hypothetical protein
MAEFFTINRYVLLIRPSQHMVAWINAIYPEDAISHEDTMKDDNTDVYLIPESADIEDARIWLEANYLPFFEALLENWCDNVDEWPEDLSWAAFQQFAEYTLQSNVIDTVSEEEDEEYADDNENGFAADSDDIDWED